MKQKRVERAIQEAREQKSMEVFNKHESELTPLERDELDDWMHPVWKQWNELSENGETIEVSNTGIVRVIETRGLVKIIHPRNDWYPFIHVLENGTNRRIPRHIHAMVAYSFVPNEYPVTRSQVNHIDGIKTHNWYKNLEWVTASENHVHAFKNGLSPRGEDHPNSIYTNDQIRRVCELLQDHPDWTEYDIGKALRVDESVVGQVFRRKLWTHVSKDYNFPSRNTVLAGEDHGKAKITNDQARHACSLLNDTYKGKRKVTHQQIADIVGSSKSLIDEISLGRSWVHISKDYDFYQAKFGDQAKLGSNDS